MARNDRKNGHQQSTIWATPLGARAIEDFRTLLLWMADEGWQSFEDERRSPEISEIYEYVARYVSRAGSSWRWLRSEELEGLLHAGLLDAEQYLQAPCIILKPNERHRIVPVVAPKFIFSGETDPPTGRYPEIRLRLGLFYKGSSGEIRVIGYRFEAPEGPAEDLQLGAHDYAHVQYINSFREEGEEPANSFDFPETTPAWPVWATDPVSMLATVWIGLYGKHAVLGCSGDVRGILERHASGLPRSPDLAYYKIQKLGVRLRSEFIVMWNEQKEYVEEIMIRRFHLDRKKRAEIFRAVEEREARAGAKAFDRRYSALWKMDLPDLSQGK